MTQQKEATDIARKLSVCFSDSAGIAAQEEVKREDLMVRVKKELQHL